jgi:hypothetical protein
MQIPEVFGENALASVDPKPGASQGERHGTDGHPVPARLNRGDGVNLSRLSSRVPVTGWANVCSAQWDMRGAHLHDISEDGVSLYLQVQIALHQEYQLQISVYRNGRGHLVNARRYCLHSTLAGLSGFRHGFCLHLIGDSDNNELREILG